MGTYTGFVDVLTTGVRHVADSVVGFGQPGEVWNLRHAYRTRYNDQQRAGGAAGDALGLIAPGLVGLAWKKRGFRIGAMRGAPLHTLQVVGGAALLAGTLVSARKVVRNAVDDGNVAAPMAALAAVGGMYAVGRFTGNQVWRAVGLLGGGAAGWFGGGLVPLGEGHIGEPSKLAAQPLTGALAPVGVARAGWIHFVEEGPLTQGISLGRMWRQPEAFRERYTDAERTAAMVGDLAALTLVTAGSIAVAGHVLGRDTSAMLRSPITKLGVELSIPAQAVNKLADIGQARNLLQLDARRRVADIAHHPTDAKNRPAQAYVLSEVRRRALKYQGKVPLVMYGAGAAMAGLTLIEAWDNGTNNKNPLLNGPASVIGAGAALIAGTVLIHHKVGFVKSLPPKARPALALVTAAAAGAVVFGVRGPIESFTSEAAYMHRKRPVGDWSIAEAGFVAAGVALGGGLGWRAVRALRMGGARPMALALGLGGLAGAGAGFGLLPSFFGTSIGRAIDPERARAAQEVAQ